MPRDYFLDLVSAKVAPSDRPYGSGMQVVEGRSRPFLVQRSWSGPAGNYRERWVISKDGVVVHSGPQRTISVWSMQALSDYSDLVTQPLDLEPGAYNLAFIVEGRVMGLVDIEVTNAPSAAA